MFWVICTDTIQAANQATQHHILSQPQCTQTDLLELTNYYILAVNILFSLKLMHPLYEDLVPPARMRTVARAALR
jgi:hypothetical protein